MFWNGDALKLICVLQLHQKIVNKGISEVRDSNHTDTDIRISDDLENLIQLAEKGPLTVKNLIEEFGSRGNAFLTLVLTTPFMLPVPTFGLSAVFGMVIAFVSIFIILDRQPILPKKLANKVLPPNHLTTFLKGSRKFISKVERLIKPRMLFLDSVLPVRILSGVMIFIATVLLALPLPPGTNAPPAFCIVLLSLSLLEKDNLFFIFGAIAFLLNLLLFGLLFFSGAKGIEFLYEYFKF